MKYPEAPGRKKAPVFVLGCGRSGTTLLYHMLLSSGGFAIYRSETNVFNLLVPRFGDLSILRNRQKLMRAWLDSKLFRVSGLAPEYIKARVLADCKSGGEFLEIVMGEIARKQNVDRWADCTPEHLLYLPQIRKALPDALVIHIIRDGRDVALSTQKQGYIRPFPWDRKRSLIVAGLYWEWIVSKGRQYGRAMGSNYMEVHFEELLSKPHETLGKLGRFINHDLDYDRIMRVGIGSVSQPNTSFGRESVGVGFNPVGRWREKFSPQELRMFEALIGKSLTELGYELATSGGEAFDGFKLKRMRGLYRAYFGSKLWIKKTNTPLSRFFVSENLSWL